MEGKMDINRLTEPMMRQFKGELWSDLETLREILVERILTLKFIPGGYDVNQ